jgi:integrase
VIDMRNITPLPSGSFRVRIEHGEHVLGGTFPKVEEAVAVRDAIKRQIADEEMIPIAGASPRDLGPQFLASRAKNRSADDDEGRWYRHIRDASIALRPVRAIESVDVLAWLKELERTKTSYDPKKHGKRAPKLISWQTRKHCLNLFRGFFKWAIQESLVATNPCAGLQVEREDGDEDEGFQDTWYLDATEQARLLECWDAFAHWKERAEKWIVAFAIGTGLRMSELWCLHLIDVHAGEDEAEPHIDVRYGSWDKVKERFRSPKGRKGEKRTRRVPLFGLALEAAREWLRILPEYSPENPLGLMFPLCEGRRTKAGLLRAHRKPPKTWQRAILKFGAVPRIGRRPWWHLLRHTCASSLVSGWWGERWALEHVRAILGHTDIKTTQRYAHLAPDAVQQVANAANDAWAASRHESRHELKRQGPQLAKIIGRARQESNLRPTAPEARGSEVNPRENRRRDGAVTAIHRALELIAARDPRALAMATAALETALDVFLAEAPAPAHTRRGAS